MGMLKNPVSGWITDESWAVMEPELERAKHSKAGKPATQSDRDFLEALIREARTGSPWRDMPAELGHWHNVHMGFRRWEQAGVWGRFWAGLPQEQLDGASALFVDSTTVRAHQHASGAPKNANDAALGRSRGGLTSKIHAATLNENQAVVIQLTLGQARGKRHRVRRPRQRLRHQRHPRPLILGRHRAGHPRTLQPHRTHRG